MLRVHCSKIVNKTFSVPVPAQDTKDDNVMVSFKCEVCDTALIYLKSILGNNATEVIIITSLLTLTQCTLVYWINVYTTKVMKSAFSGWVVRSFF